MMHGTIKLKNSYVVAYRWYLGYNNVRRLIIPCLLLFHFQWIICLNSDFHSVVKTEIVWDVTPYRLINTVELGYNVMCRYKRAL